MTDRLQTQRPAVDHVVEFLLLILAPLAVLKWRYIRQLGCNGAEWIPTEFKLECADEIRRVGKSGRVPEIDVADADVVGVVQLDDLSAVPKTVE